MRIGNKIENGNNLRKIWLEISILHAFKFRKIYSFLQSLFIKFLLIQFGLFKFLLWDYGENSNISSNNDPIFNKLYFLIQVFMYKYV